MEGRDLIREATLADLVGHSVELATITRRSCPISRRSP